ncbi:MAG: hypothetical protein AAFQ82_20115 [Myxococcota bacterium]
MQSLDSSEEDRESNGFSLNAVTGPTEFGLGAQCWMGDQWSVDFNLVLGAPGFLFPGRDDGTSRLLEFIDSYMRASVGVTKRVAFSPSDSTENAWTMSTGLGIVDPSLFSTGGTSLSVEALTGVSLVIGRVLEMHPEVGVLVSPALEHGFVPLARVRFGIGWFGRSQAD